MDGIGCRQDRIKQIVRHWFSSAVYVFWPPFNVIEYVDNLPVLDGLPFFVFMLHGTHPGTAGNILRKRMEQKGGREAGYARFKGADFFVGYIQREVLFSPENPVSDELERARRLGRESAKFAADGKYEKPPTNPLPPVVYSFERMLTIKPLTTYFYSNFLKADSSKCNSCGLCVKICPQNNIKLDQDGIPCWGCNCILCGYCEMRCPEDAITTPFDWTAFAPLLLYNIHHSNMVY